MQLAQHAPPERRLRQHALDRELEYPLRVLLQQLAERDRLQVAQVAGVMVVELVVELVAGHGDLLGVQHDDVVAHVHVGAVVGLVLALEPHGDLRREAAERLAAGIDDIPIPAHFRGLYERCLHGLRGSDEVEKGAKVYSRTPSIAKAMPDRSKEPRR